ncbi:MULTISPECIES: DUF721 domain-containing protein [unclassified Mucilaginibacter]|uniref:DUF721 domain-containing protein n=1 Tax=unclassified Mucilaginibacter TaxID=2617802 RepID=UPI002AC97D58|nr:MULTISPECIES: DUF721 domain-containing protein [unclassified Mucilaginibacter]MEB0262240.1 DUF721 domain-containing protein [Mucilaginibacter sp. 10I4]MEB0278645.1 DUF721 domain-containing protein [Mucilaginibacter sp. 10B2]MEB0299355.1 DUF721 domain-containing protein [Mucilaginibacter sp. 5C4]WPX23401.1 DUF721 domain-containing protein [Mucilaginibacter sp. 5C4]
MRKANDKSLKEAIEQMLNVYKIKRKFDETAIVTLWPDIVGKSVANRTKELFIKDKKLFLRIESSVIKHELVMMREQIIQKINDFVKTELVADIVFI